MDKKEGVCPVCNGTKRVPAGDSKYKEVFAGYDKATDTLECNNCGSQYMFCSATGTVPLRSDGTPCKHSYMERKVRMCLHEYVCRHCGDRFQIDSSD